jgi:hypothetical protein
MVVLAAELNGAIMSDKQNRSNPRTRQRIRRLGTAGGDDRPQASISRRCRAKRRGVRPELNKAEASKKIDELQHETGAASTLSAVTPQLVTPDLIRGPPSYCGGSAKKVDAESSPA